MATHPTYHTILVTGANSFYAGGVIQRLLALYPGTKIHAAVRRESAITSLQSTFGSQINGFVTPDITAPDAYLRAAANCTAIFHIASPLSVTINDAKKDMLDPAINGCLSALNAAAKTPSVKRVVLTSSVGSIMSPLHPEPEGFLRPGYVYTEADWNPMTYDEAAQYNTFAPVYPAAKKLSESAAWDFMAKEPRGFDLVAICPVHTFGAYIGTATSQSDVSFTNESIVQMMDGDLTDVPPPGLPQTCTLDEVVQGHVKGLLTPAAGGNRYIIHNASFDFQKVADLIHREFKGEDWVKNVPKGTPGAYVDPKTHFDFDPTKSKQELGVVYGNWEQGVIDLCKKYAQDRKAWTS